MTVHHLVSHLDRSLSGRLLLLGIVAGLFFLGWQVHGANASNGTDYFFCVDNRSGNVRLVDNPSKCGLRDTPFNLGDDLGLATDADIEALEERITDLEQQNADLLALLDGVSRVDDGDTLQFSGMNVQIVNDLGATDTKNGLGNLIVGYNEAEGLNLERDGSHNLVVGPSHDYTSYGGFVAGFRNTVSGAHATVSGGRFSQATGPHSSVSGGQNHLASGDRSSVTGGIFNTASANSSSVHGGQQNVANEFQSSILGGFGNTTSGDGATVSGGQGNEAEGRFSSILGGTGVTVTNDFETSP